MGTASQETCFLIKGELPTKADPEYSFGEDMPARFYDFRSGGKGFMSMH